jgi:hypothetical protein
VRRADNLGSGRLVLVVGKGGEIPGVGFHEGGVARVNEGFYASGGDAYSGFMVFNFFGDADDHFRKCLAKEC